MRIILTKDVRGVGKRFDEKEVSEGYARNFLFPKKLAVPADAKHRSLKTEHDAKTQTEISKLKDLAVKLEREPLVFKVKTGIHGEVFGSVTTKDIEKRLKEKGILAKIILSHALKSLGEHKIEVDFGQGIRGIVIVRLETE